MLTDYLVSDVEAVALRQSLKVKAPSSKFIAMVLVNKGKFPGIGGSYTPDGGAPTVVTAGNIASLLRDLAFQGGAHFFGNGTINGTRPKPTEVTEGDVYGTAFKAKPTGEIQVMPEFTFKHFFRNIPFFNDLRRNARGRDIYLFTDSSVEKIDFETNRPIFEAIGHTITGERERTISGSFAISYNDLNGELVPAFGINLEDLESETMVYTFDTPSALVNLTQQAGCAGDCITFNRTAAGTCGFTADVVEAKGCGKHYLYYNDNEAFPVGVTGSVNPSTGLISFTALSAGTHRFTHVFENEVGVFGYYCFKIIASA
ncbi:hypothetical protein [Runella salmonicolor]|uniref:Uncharacterized protein n=1 Tax=Runella salmonicolor TaxID=2950278 RepID=A0ABT1FSX1_9BACT|nr:hypothetical protein [Runella salmonicolor]MCP1384802.1 hypothetical protein [Runella salmonicolor]